MNKVTSVHDIDWNYVNLASRPDRNTHALAEFAKHDIKATRFEGLLPEQWEGDPYKVQRMQNRTPGAIGCYASQMSLIKRVSETGKVTAVCEDDVCFCSDFPTRIQYIAENVLNVWDWDIFYLGATFHVPGKWCYNRDCSTWGTLGVDVQETSDKRILRTYGIWCTYCYLVNPDNAAKVYRAFDNNIADADGIDHLAIRLGPQLNTYCFVPGCTWQYDNESNIGNGITRFSGFKKLGPYAWQDRMEDFDPESFDWKTGATL